MVSFLFPPHLEHHPFTSSTIGLNIPKTLTITKAQIVGQRGPPPAFPHNSVLNWASHPSNFTPNVMNTYIHLGYTFVAIIRFWKEFATSPKLRIQALTPVASLSLEKSLVKIIFKVTREKNKVLRRVVKQGGIWVDLHQFSGPLPPTDKVAFHVLPT